MANLLTDEKTRVETALHSIYGSRLPMRTVTMHVRCLAREIAMDALAGSVCHQWIGRIRDHWDKAEGLLRSFATAPPQTEIQES